MMAPRRAAGAAMRRAANKLGKAARIRTFTSAVHDRRPADMPTRVVKKTLTPARTTFGWSPLNTMLRMGAMAMIGMQ